MSQLQRIALTMVCIAYCLLFLASPALADVSEIHSTISSAKTSKANMIGFEGLGRGFLYSAFYERALSDKTLSLGIGFTYMDSSSSHEPIIPVYANFFTSSLQSRGYFTGGFTQMEPGNFFSDNGKNRGIYRYGLPMAGMGWEYKTSDDWVLRASGYVFLLFAPIAVLPLPWVGASVAKVF